MISADVSLSDVSKLRLFVVSLNPDISLDQIDHLHTGRDQLPILYVALADCAIVRSIDARVAQIDLGNDDGCLLGLNVRPIPGIAGVERGELQLLRLEQRTAAVKRRLRPLQVGFATGQHSGELVGIRNRAFERLMSGRLGSKQRLLALALKGRPLYFWLHRGDAGLGGLTDASAWATPVSAF